MSDSSYPALLNKRAKVLLNLNRTDLVFSSGVLLLFSFLGVSGVNGLLLNIALLVVFKVVSLKLPKSFFELSKSPTFFEWRMPKGAEDE